MKDNELFKHFKDRSDSFNEPPGDQLWSRIEGQLNITPNSAMVRKGVMYKALIATGVIAIAGSIVIFNYLEKQNIEPAVIKTEQPQQIINEPVVTEPAPEEKQTVGDIPEEKPVIKEDSKKPEPKKDPVAVAAVKKEPAPAKKEAPATQKTTLPTTALKGEELKSKESETIEFTIKKEHDSLQTDHVNFNRVFSPDKLTKQPEFPGGTQAFYVQISRKFVVKQAIPEGDYKVNISFVIEKDGTLSNIKAIDDPGYGFSEQVIKAFSSLTQKWTPGQIDGRPVRTSYNLPFSINIKKG